MAAFERTPVTNEACSREVAAGAQVVVLLRGEAVPACSLRVAASFYLRKMMAPAEAGRFVVSVEDDAACRHVAAYLSPSPDVVGFLAWVDAVDFLLADVPRAVAWATLCATLGDDGSALCLPFERCSDEDGAVSCLGGAADPYDSCMRVDGAAEGARAPEPPWSVAEFCRKMSGVWQRLFPVEACVQLYRCGELSFLRGRVVEVLLRKLGDPPGALDVLASAASLLGGFFGDEIGRWLVHRALSTLYAAERRGDLCSVPLALVHSLQRLYVRGALNLECFVPRRSTPRLCTLPGLRGRGDVARVLSSEEQLEGKLLGLVPWLADLGPGLCVTGSMLCHALLEAPSADETWPGPGDVDVYCEKKEGLAEAHAQVSGALIKFARERCEAGWELLYAEPNASRRVLRVASNGRHRAELSCDLYVNSLAQVQKYHLPLVRASWDLRESRLYLAPSCAVALATSLNVDCHIFAGRGKTPQQILANKWLWGFNYCLSSADAEVMQAHLAEFHLDALVRAEVLMRPGRLSLGSYRHLEEVYGRPS